MVTYYKEPSLGVFKIKSKDKDLVEAFEKIRSSIKKQL
ncbi:hypothetical protein MNB_SV-14-228 [hydrothermal vent metagenome]|uniref:Uncharacterized protein n=1 Tax=hydrothermal vent metagenome TaxID=652676 RepID=A0A1W1BIC7_9ZZZZ